MKETTKKIVSKRLTKVVALVLMCVICTSGVITVTALSRDVTVLDGDKRYGLTTLNANPDAAVSYTHLDVYKRQGDNRFHHTIKEPNQAAERQQGKKDQRQSQHSEAEVEGGERE